MIKITADASEMYKFLMCKDGDYVITAQNSHIIEKEDFDYDGYLVEDEEACENFWNGGLEGKCLFSKKINILGEDGEVRLVGMVEGKCLFSKKINILGEDGEVRLAGMVYEDDDDCSCYEDIDFKKFEFVRLEKIKAEISAINWSGGLQKAEIDVYYPIFKLKN